MRVLVSDCDGFHSVVECCRVSILNDAPQYKDKLVVVFDIDSNEQNSICVTKKLSHNTISSVNVVVEELYQKGTACFTTSNGFSEYEFFDWDEYDLELDKEVNGIDAENTNIVETETITAEIEKNSNKDFDTDRFSSSYANIYSDNKEQSKKNFWEKLVDLIAKKEED